MTPTVVTATTFNHCGVVEDGPAGGLLIDGVALSPASGDVPRSQRTGMSVAVSDEGLATVTEAALPGCEAAAAASPTPEPSASAEPTTSPEPSTSEEPEASGKGDGGTLPDTAFGPGPGDFAVVVIVGTLCLGVVGLWAHHRDLVRSRPRRPPVRWKPE
jgi:hypothetical protein